jgi:hypothetical protein
MNDGRNCSKTKVEACQFYKVTKTLHIFSWSGQQTKKKIYTTLYFKTSRRYYFKNEYQGKVDELESTNGIITDTKDILETVVDVYKKIVWVFTQT